MIVFIGSTNFFLVYMPSMKDISRQLLSLTATRINRKARGYFDSLR